jgi:hypothetical protein
MRKTTFALIMTLPFLTACDFTGEKSAVTETRIDDLDSLEGTISDEMVDTNSLNETPLIEAAPPAGSKPVFKDKGEKADKTEKAPAKTNAVVDAAENKAEDN